MFRVSLFHEDGEVQTRRAAADDVDSHPVSFIPLPCQYSSVRVVEAIGTNYIFTR